MAEGEKTLQEGLRTYAPAEAIPRVDPNRAAMWRDMNDAATRLDHLEQREAEGRTLAERLRKDPVYSSIGVVRTAIAHLDGGSANG